MKKKKRKKEICSPSSNFPRVTRDRISVEPRFIRHCRNLHNASIRSLGGVTFRQRSVWKGKQMTLSRVHLELNDHMAKFDGIYSVIHRFVKYFHGNFAHMQWDVITFAFHAMNTHVCAS